jgi:hypothetical protein
MPKHDVVVYKAGQRIDTRQPLQVENLPKEKWGPIGEAYPEIATLVAGSPASFFGKPNVTIFPPTYVSKGALKMLASSQEPRTRWVYTSTSPHPHERLEAVLVYLVGGYDSVHIYRLAPKVQSR